MAEVRNDKSKAIEVALLQIEKQFGKGSIMRLGDKEAIAIPTISTGALSIDAALGIGGVPRGRVVEIFGPESSGKTTLALHIIAEAQKTGGMAAFIDAEHALDPEYARKLGVNIDNLLVSQPDSGEQALEIAEMLIRSGAIGLLMNIVLFNLDGFNRLNPSLEAGLIEPTATPAKPLAVAQALQELGVVQGDRVGVIGYAYDSFWARLARVQIVAEMLEADAVDLWLGDEALRQSVLQSFSGTGAKAVVAEYVPDYVQLKDWHQVGNSNYYIYVFAEQ